MMIAGSAPGLAALNGHLTEIALSIASTRLSPRISWIVSRCAVCVPEEFVLADLNEARGICEEITGKRTSEDVLAAIFSRFCIGK